MDKKRVAVLTAGHMGNDIYSGFLTPLLPLLINKLEFSLALAGALVSLRAIFSFVI